MSIAFRQRQDSDTWHFCKNCSSWPETKYVEMWKLPTNSEVCEHCKEMQRRGICRMEAIRNCQPEIT